MGRGNNMDADLRAGLERIQASIDKVDSRLETHILQFSQHCIEDARVQQEILSSTQASHKRLDEHTEDHKTEKAGRFSLWIGVILAFLGAAFAAAFSWFSGGKK